MGGGLMQLVLKGKMDTYLTGTPEFSFFKAVYRRHTNFSIESIRQQITNKGSGERIMRSKLSRAGDLIGKMALEVKLNRGDARNVTNTGTYLNWVNNTGHAFIKECELKIGGQTIDKHTSKWLDIQNEMYDKYEQEWIGINKHPGKFGYFKKGNKNIDSQELKLYIPFHFWFCDNPGLYLPIIGITNHEVELHILTRSVEYLFNLDGQLAFTNTEPDVELWCDYIFLDNDEKRKFTLEKKAYLIQQVQIYEKKMESLNELKLYHPIKELYWVIQESTVNSESGNGRSDTDSLLNVSGQPLNNKNDYFNYQSKDSGNKEIIYATSSFESFKTAKLCLNGNDRFYERDASYFRLLQPLNCGLKVPTKHIYMYSFSLNPKEFQPSGTCNFSRIDDIQLVFTSGYNFVNERLYVYAVNYNVLVISSGMAGLVYK